MCIVEEPQIARSEIQWNPAITNPAITKPLHNEQHLKARQNYSKICGNKTAITNPAIRNPRCNVPHGNLEPFESQVAILDLNLEAVLGTRTLI